MRPDSLETFALYKFLAYLLKLRGGVRKTADYKHSK